MALSGITGADNITSTLSEVDIEVHSKEILYTAQPDLFYEQLGIQRQELGLQPGQKIDFLKYNDINEGDELVEGTRMVVDDISTSSVQIVVKEWGKAIALTELLLRASPYNIMESVVKLMSDNYARTSNISAIRTLFQSAPNTMYGAGRANRAAMIGSDVLTMDLVQDIAADKATRNVPKMRSTFQGMSSAYVMVCHPHVARTIKRDDDFIKSRLYGAPETLFNGEIGIAADEIRLVQTTYIPVIKHPGTYSPYAGGDDVTPANTVGHVFINGVNMTDRKPLLFPAQTIPAGSTKSYYQSIIIGDRAFGVAETLPVGLRHNGVIDFERERGLAWYAIRGTGLINSDQALLLETFVVPST